MSETPRTDAETVEAGCKKPGGTYVMADFARQLEQELATDTEQLLVMDKRIKKLSMTAAGRKGALKSLRADWKKEREMRTNEIENLKRKHAGALENVAKLCRANSELADSAVELERLKIELRETKEQAYFRSPEDGDKGETWEEKYHEAVKEIHRLEQDKAGIIQDVNNLERALREAKDLRKGVETVAREFGQTGAAFAELESYPNLSAILQGTIAGKFSDWPAVAPELRRFAASVAVLRHDKLVVDFLETQRRHYSRPPLRAVTGWEWVLVDETGLETLREAVLKKIGEMK